MKSQREQKPIRELFATAQSESYFPEPVHRKAFRPPRWGRALSVA